MRPNASGPVANILQNVLKKTKIRNRIKCFQFEKNLNENGNHNRSHPQWLWMWILFNKNWDNKFNSKRKEISTNL